MRTSVKILLFLRKHCKWANTCEWREKLHNSGRFVLTKTLSRYTALTKLSTHSNSGCVVVAHLCKEFSLRHLSAVWPMDNFIMRFFLNCVILQNEVHSWIPSNLSREYCCRWSIIFVEMLIAFVVCFRFSDTCTECHFSCICDNYVIL